MNTKGLIAIDIDGTLTSVPNVLPPQVIAYLQKIHRDGWNLLFVTGRTVYWASKLLHDLPFDFFLSAFNGAYTLNYREKKIIKKSYLPLERIFQVVNLVKDHDVGIAFYGAPDIDDRSFLFRKFASHVVQNHLMQRAKVVKDPWSEVDNVMDLPLDDFAAMRLFCLPHTAKHLSALIEDITPLHAPMMKDSYNDSFSVVQVTHKDVSKGKAMECVLKFLGELKPVIACGDDHNDISMLKQADIAVVMANAPSEVVAHADIIAPPASQEGIIVGITKALELLHKKGT